MLIKPWNGVWKTKPKITNLKVDEENGKALGMVNRRYQKVCRLSRNEFWRNISCLVSAHSFSIVRSRLWDKEEAIFISGKKKNMR